MARRFSERERETIKRRLMDACKRSWTRYGCRKTSVDGLCEEAGISKGAFYLFYPSKEALFCDVLCAEQRRIYEAASEVLDRRGDRAGAVEALKLIYREYAENNFLYDADSADFSILMNRLSEEQAGEIEESNRRNRQLFSARLRCKVKEELALSVLYSLLMTVKNRDILPYGHQETFDFMIEHLIDSLYE